MGSEWRSHWRLGLIWLGAGFMAGCGGADGGQSISAGQDATGQERESANVQAASNEQADMVSLPSGLQYQVLIAADGPRPAAEHLVTVHYEGRLLDGTVFDSSLQRGVPAQFRLNRVIAGWTEGLQLMAPGAKWRLTIPPELAYGSRGAGNLIGPNATLEFDVELISFSE